jgi:hypothetical protein
MFYAYLNASQNRELIPSTKKIYIGKIYEIVVCANAGDSSIKLTLYANTDCTKFCKEKSMF